MPYFTNKLGVVPKTYIDDSPGWILVPDPPLVPEGKEIVWLNWEWVVRDSKPENREGYVWKFVHSEFKSNSESNGWVEYALPFITVEEVEESSNVVVEVTEVYGNIQSLLNNLTN